MVGRCWRISEERGVWRVKGCSRSCIQFYAGGQKTNQAASITETRAATQQP